MTPTKPTLDELRAKAERAKRWVPAHRCLVDVACECCICVGTTVCPCDACLGAKRAAEDVAQKVDWCMNIIESGAQSSSQSASTESRAASSNAARIESYFGAPGPVSDFARAVEAYCNA